MIRHRRSARRHPRGPSRRLVRGGLGGCHGPPRRSRQTGSHHDLRHAQHAFPGRRYKLYRPVSIEFWGRIPRGKGATWQSWTGESRHSRCPMRWSWRTGPPKSATSIQTFPDGGRIAVAPGLADGVPSRRDPRRGDFVEYEILDQSVVVGSTATTWAPRLSQLVSASRHEGRAGPRVATSFVCPFHGWC